MLCALPLRAGSSRDKKTSSNMLTNDAHRYWIINPFFLSLTNYEKKKSKNTTFLRRSRNVGRQVKLIIFLKFGGNHSFSLCSCLHSCARNLPLPLLFTCIAIFSLSCTLQRQQLRVHCRVRGHREDSCARPCSARGRAGCAASPISGDAAHALRCVAAATAGGLAAFCACGHRISGRARPCLLRGLAGCTA